MGLLCCGGVDSWDMEAVHAGSRWLWGGGSWGGTRGYGAWDRSRVDGLKYELSAPEIVEILEVRV